MQNKSQKELKQLLVISKKCPRAVKELAGIRGDSHYIGEAFDAYKESDAAIKLVKKKRASLMLAPIGSTHLVLGRTFNNEFIDLVKFKIVKMFSSDDFATVPAQFFMKCAVLIHNIENKRLESLIVDLFSQRTPSISLDALQYAWIFTCTEDIYTLKYVRIRADYSTEDIGPYFELSIEKEHYCGEEMWKKASETQEKKAKKNISKTTLKETVGKVYIDKQDLHDVRLRKTKGYKMGKSKATEY